MSRVVNYFKKQPTFILGLVVLLGIFFRSYQAVERFDFGHDGDLSSWIVKDILVNHHFRLIGQLTSAPGIFIGPLFYYLLIPFFLLTKMDPIGVSILGILIGVFTIVSYYFVVSKIFNKTAGLLAAFLHAVLNSTVNFDRWIVPTLPTKLWAIWYLYCLFMIRRGNYSVLPLLGILIGLIWHIHIALAPTLLVLPLVIILSKKLPKKRELVVLLLFTLISSLPFLVFETRHNFSQSKNLIRNFTANFGSGDTISEEKQITFGKPTDYTALNFNPETKFTLDVIPNNPQISSNVILKLTTKNPKYSTMVINLDCGKNQKFEIGSISGEFNWSTNGCTEGLHKLIATARIPRDPFWKTIVDKFINVLDKENRNIYDIFLSPFRLPSVLKQLLTLVILLCPFIAWRIKALSKGQSLIFYSWILAVFLFFTFSSIILSEYYLASLDTLIIISVSLIFSRIVKNKIGRYFVFILLGVFLIKNSYFFAIQNDYKKGYLEKKSVIQSIVFDIKKNNFPCVAINYITNIGDNVGFRYFIWLNNIKTVKAGKNIPTYNIVIPYELVGKIDQKFGNIGIIRPQEQPSEEAMKNECQLSNNLNLTESMFGYVD